MFTCCFLGDPLVCNGNSCKHDCYLLKLRTGNMFLFSDVRHRTYIHWFCFCFCKYVTVVVIIFSVGLVNYVDLRVFSCETGCYLIQSLEEIC